MPSAREHIASCLVDTCVCCDFSTLKARVTNASGKTHWSIAFCKPGAVDGEIKVHSPTHIRISWKTGCHDLPATGSKACGSELGAKKVLMRFVR